MDNELKNDELNNGSVTFYYSREKRLRRASKPVLDISNPAVKQKTSLFRTLTATKPLTFLFISIITICAAIIMLSHFLNIERVRTLGNNTVTVSIIGSGDNSYITIKKTMQDADVTAAYAGAVDVAVSAYSKENKSKEGEENPIHAERIYFGLEQEEIIRFVAPFRGEKILVLMEAGAERVLFTITPE